MQLIDLVLIVQSLIFDQLVRKSESAFSQLFGHPLLRKSISRTLLCWFRWSLWQREREGYVSLARVVSRTFSHS